MRVVATVTLILVKALPAFSADAQPGADEWLAGAPPLPVEFATPPPSKVAFADLRAEAIAGRLRVSWDGAASFDNVCVVSSADAPGHWPARDWRSSPMTLRGTAWQTELPVDSLSVPVVYFLRASNREGVIASPLRMARPGALGLEQPTRILWPFVEGFEQGLEGWRVIHGPVPRTASPAKHGRAALAVAVPAGQKSVTVVTTRLRGWFLQEHRATGLELWLRTRDANGKASFELLADAFSTNQIIARRAGAIAVGPKWTKVELPFSTFPKFPIGDLDMLSIELTGEPGTEFLIDDVQLIGPWRSLL